MASNNWWNSRSAVDDGLDLDDERDARDESWLDDFDFEDVASERQSTIGSIWGRYSGSYRPAAGVASTASALRLVSAQRMVQGFVDTFATGDKRYVVTFDESVVTAGTDFVGRKVVVSHKPLFDPTLDEDGANTILTAMAVHESAHVRYGRNTAKAINGHADRRAARISNILDDVRIERRFTEDYPGYAGVFRPALDYVATAATKGALVDPTKMDELGRLVATVRYTHHVAWTDETAAERDWWLDWADRGASKDTPAHHLAAVNEAIAHLDEVAAAEAAKPKPSTGTPGQQDGGNGQTSGQQDSGDDETETNPATGSLGGNDGGYGAPAGDALVIVLPDCFADGIESAAEDHGQTAWISDQRAQEMVNEGQALVEYGDDGRLGEVYWAPGGVARRKAAIGRVAGASAAIRAAFARSRTGHDATTHGLRSGRISNRSLHRIAGDDVRIFSKRTAQSEGRFRVWLMVDCSISMEGRPLQDAMAVSAALASATRQLPNVALDVWGWTDSLKFYQASFSAVRVYADGGPVANIGYLDSIRNGGTPDGESLKWAVKAIKKAAKPGETPVVIMASDGEGSLSDFQKRGDDIVGEARRSGVEVLSVALGGLDKDNQERIYGKGGYVAWAGSIAATAGPLGRIIGRMAAGTR